MTSKVEEKRLIEEFVIWLERQCSCKSSIEGWPDESERTKKACDALAIIGGRPIAIEHTSLDSFSEHRKDDAHFSKLMVPLEKSLSRELHEPGYYTLAIPVGVIPTGTDWDVLRSRIEQWVLAHAGALKPGDPSTAPEHMLTGRPSGVPFDITLSRWPGKQKKIVYVLRDAPGDLEPQRQEVIRNALSTRGVKVAQYRTDGRTSVLLFETRDIALANHVLIGEATERALRKLSEELIPDQIYLADTSKGVTFFHTLKVGHALFPLAKPSFPSR